MKQWIVGPEDVNLRADVFISSKYPEYTRSSLERLFDKGRVQINSKPIKAGYKTRKDETLFVDDSELRHKPEPIELPIIYEDEDVIVINKPEGVLTHTKGALNDESTVASFISNKLNDKALTGNRAGIVHRLDRWTSGVIICAKNAAALSKLQKQFSQRKTKKSYVAIVEGAPKEVTAIIDAPIERNPKKPQTFRISSTGKSAITEYKVVSEIKRGNKTYSIVELFPKTGRTHQLRVHMAYIGTPILGDKVYGTGKEHMYLHAKSLELTLPNSERKVFSAPLPAYFKEYTDV